MKQRSDKKPLEGYDKDSERVHRWLLIEFINEKWNYVIIRNVEVQLKRIVSDWSKQCIGKCNGRKFRS